ncbi:hypothetical protein PRN20_05990 [Devosia sp. ZB163]|uniref:hypothetical protein n=1 Tax=Devosia sp. ZB163 TaxID=3025938 RepID=UPI00235F6169|nr:hypothetical protein [Devosia sp. ZB163]MDC9823275.1 hypothetical protein [Devosia sp. ZB163]
MTDAGGKRGRTGSGPLTASSSRDSNREPSATNVEDNWPEGVPVATGELEVIEIWLRTLLDELFGGDDA